MPLSLPDFIASRLAHPVAVMGAGVSGRGAVALLTRLGAKAVVYDRNGLEFTPGAARGHELVVFSPGFPLLHPWLETARKAGCICMAEIDFASLFWRGRIIAVTGTNGKTTLTEFLAGALSGAGRRSLAAGNSVSATRAIPMKSHISLKYFCGSASRLSYKQTSTFSRPKILNHSLR